MTIVDRSPLYLIEFGCINTGKRVASSKKRIIWRFGFTDQKALAAGKTGALCRGQEHEVTLIWSVTSGKRVVLFNKQEVHFSTSHNSQFKCSWMIQRNKSPNPIHIQIDALLHPSHITHKQYNLLIDDQSIFDYPKFDELGLPYREKIELAGRRRPSFSDKVNYEDEKLPRFRGKEEYASFEDSYHNPVDHNYHSPVDRNPYYDENIIKAAPSSARRKSSGTHMDLLSDPTLSPAPTTTTNQMPSASTTPMMVNDNDPFAPKAPTMIDGILSNYDVSAQPQYNNYTVPNVPIGGVTPGNSPPQPYGAANPTYQTPTTTTMATSPTSTKTSAPLPAPLLPASKVITSMTTPPKSKPRPQPAPALSFPNVVSPTTQPKQTMPNSASAPAPPNVVPLSPPPSTSNGKDEYANPFIINGNNGGTTPSSVPIHSQVPATNSTPTPANMVPPTPVSAPTPNVVPQQTTNQAGYYPVAAPPPKPTNTVPALPNQGVGYYPVSAPPPKTFPSHSYSNYASSSPTAVSAMAATSPQNSNVRNGGGTMGVMYYGQ